MPKTDQSDRTGGSSSGNKPPSLVPGVVLLGVAAALIVVLIVNPEMSDGARKIVAGISIAVVIALLGYAGYVFYASTKRGRK